MDNQNGKWDDRYMAIAQEVSTWSKDPRRKIGAVIVGDYGQILSTGYNGFPRGVKDDPVRYMDRTLKNKFIVHAEMNAILNASFTGTSLKGSTIYIYGLPPCCDCTKAIINAGISKILYSDLFEDEKWASSFAVSNQMFTEAGVIVIKR